MPNPAESYEHAIVPHLFRPWAQRLIDRFEPQPGERVLDVACGTGVVAREVAARRRSDVRIAGADPSAAMLAVAEQQAAAEGAEIEWRQADARELPYPDQSFDVLFCQQGLQFVPDREAAAREMFRVLAPGGRAAISVWREIDRHTFFHALDRVMRERLDLPAASAPFQMPDPDELRGVLEQAGFTDVAIEQPSMPARYPEPERNLYVTIHALVAVAPSLQALDDQQREAMIDEISREMHETHAAHIEGNRVVLQWHANVATARRPA